MFSTVFSAFGGCGVSRFIGVPGFAAAALVRFFAGDAEPPARAEGALRAPVVADLRAFEAVALGALAPDVFFFLAPVFVAARLATALAS
ncbi:MAG TPA: hypothetical protein VFF43_20300, partial [Caldimonas sp.]|nr:hypothetical protein [Caldimonas sp.]